MENKKVYIIAEAGVNHNGDIGNAFKLVDAAKDAGADAVKFQMFKSNQMTSRKASKADYQKETTDENQSQLDMLKKLEMGYEEHLELLEYCRGIDIDFLSSPFDITSINELKALGMSVYKIPSGEITNYPYLKEIAKTKKPVILSTGMSNIEEIQEALEILLKGTGEITLLHCNTQYPTPMEDVNLMAMITMKSRFGYKVGYSDHTQGIEVPIAAVAMGAEIIEKHFTLDKNMEGPDHKASLEPEELKQMVKSIRNIEKALGDGVKKASPSEQGNICVARKSIVARCEIAEGEEFTVENITTKRPGTGLSPMKWNELIGKKSGRDYKEDEFVGNEEIKKG